MAFIRGGSGGSGVAPEDITWAPTSANSVSDWVQTADSSTYTATVGNGAISNGSCMVFVVYYPTDKTNSHYIINYDTGGANPGLALRYWQPTDSWYAYCNDTASTGNVATSATGNAAGAKVLLGILISGTSLSISVNGAWTSGGTATPFTSTRLIANRSAASFGKIYDMISFTAYNTSTAKRVEGMLAAKHGITLAAGHPYRLGAPTQEWLPSDDTGGVIWYDFADSSTITVTGAGISNLTNKAAVGGYTLTQSTDANRPTWDGSTATGRSVIPAVTTGLRLTSSIGFTAAAYTSIHTTKLGNYDPNSMQVWVVNKTGARSQGEWVSTTANTYQTRTQAAAVTSNNVETYTAESGLNIRGLVFDGLAGGTHTPYKNGTAFAAYTNASNNVVTGDDFWLLKDSSINCTIGDFIVTSSTSTATRQRLEGYLAHKRGLQGSLPTSHPWRLQKPTLANPWVPTDDPGNLIWYDFADSSTITITGAGISQITNKAAGGGYTLTQGTDAYRPTWDGSVAFGRGNSVFGGLGISTSIPWTNGAYLVLQTNQLLAANGSFGRSYRVRNAAAFDISQTFINSSGSRYRARVNNVTGSTGEWDLENPFSPSPETALSIRSLSFNGAPGGVVTTWKNGTATTGTSGAGVNPDVGAELYLLASNATNINMGDFIVTTTTSDTTRQKYEGYLAHKRGLEANLPSDHPYKTRPPLTSD